MKQRSAQAIIAWLLLIILGGLVIHTPVSVWLVSQGAPVWVKAWKEIVLLLAAFFLLREAVLQRARYLLQDRMLWLVAGYIGLHLLIACFSSGSLTSIAAGLMIDLRYVAYFAALYVFLRLYPGYRSSFIKVGVIGATIVTGFVLLQLVLPADSLKYLGYSDATIKPYILLDENPHYVRMNSTLRGPNPLGAYAMIVLLGVVAYGMAVGRTLKHSPQKWAHLLLAVGGAVALWVSYSRSALVGLVTGMMALGAAVIRAKHVTIRPQYVAAVVAGIVTIGLVGYSLRTTTFYKNLVLHDNPTTGAEYTSDQGHADSLGVGITKMLQQPLGAGVGSTGSASLSTDKPLIIENQYLMVAHEAGWLGLGLFVALWATVLWRLWQRREDWLAQLALASGIGLAVIAMSWPVLVDDPVSMIWWALAAVAIAGGVKTTTKGNKRGTTTHKKAARTA